MPIFQNPFVLLVVLQKLLLRIILLQVSSLIHILQFSMLLLPLLLFTNFQMHFPHSCSNTQCKCKTQIHCEKTLNAKKLNDHSFLFIFRLGLLVIFALNVVFLEAPCSFHDGFFVVRPCGSNYCFSMVHMHFDPLPSSIFHHNTYPSIPRLLCHVYGNMSQFINTVSRFSYYIDLFLFGCDR